MLSGLLRQDPLYHRATLSLAAIRFEQARFRESLTLVSAIIDQGADALNRATLAKAYALAGGAQRMLAYHGGLVAKLRAGRSAGRSMAAAESLAPDLPDVLYARGSYALIAPAKAGGSLDKALTCLQAAVDKEPGHVDAWARLAQAYRAKGDQRKYAECLAKALELDPRSVVAQDIQEGTGVFGQVAPDRR